MISGELDIGEVCDDGVRGSGLYCKMGWDSVELVIMSEEVRL